MLENFLIFMNHVIDNILNCSLYFKTKFENIYHMGCSHVRKKMSDYLQGYGRLNDMAFAISECDNKNKNKNKNNNNNKDKNKNTNINTNTNTCEDSNQKINLISDDGARKYEMHDVFNRCSKRDINIDGKSYKLCSKSKTYMNRHLIYPDEAKKNHFYKVDVCAKTKTLRGEWVKLIGWKWITKASRLTWYCRLCSNGKYVHTYFIDATTCTNSSSQDLSGIFDKIKLT